MAKIRMTKHWEDIKHNYFDCLCYSQEKGFYTRCLLENEENKDLIYRPHGYYGYISDHIDIPEANLHIQINSNFGYCSKAYLNAKLTYKGKVALDFDLDKLHILNHCSITLLSAHEYDWNTLFKKIIDAHKQILSGNIQPISISYIDKVGEMLTSKAINVKSTFAQKDYTKWGSDFLVTLHAGKKIRDLIEGICLAEFKDELITNRLLDLCRKYVSKVVSLNINPNDSRTPQISDTLLSIHNFMSKNKVGVDYLRIILNYNH